MLSFYILRAYAAAGPLRGGKADIFVAGVLSLAESGPDHCEVVASVAIPASALHMGCSDASSCFSSAEEAGTRRKRLRPKEEARQGGFRGDRWLRNFGREACRARQQQVQWEQVPQDSLDVCVHARGYGMCTERYACMQNG